MNHQLYAGAGCANITPCVGGMLYGYNDDTYSTSCHDDLEIKALALSPDGSAENAVLMLSLSLGDFGITPCMEVREILAGKTGVSVDRILCSTTHTHSAPNVCGVAGWGEIDRPYMNDILIPGAVKASMDAIASLQPAEFAVAEGESEVGVNRREIFEDGHIDFGQNTWAPQDKTMTVIRFRHAETKAGIFQMIHYGCHGTASGNNHEITRDWIGIMTDRMEAETGIMTGFWNGCVGDVGPRIANGGTTGDIRHAEELGGRAALDAIRIAKPLDRALYEAPALRVVSTVFDLPCRLMPSAYEVDAYFASHPRTAHYVNIEGLIDAYMQAAADVYAGKLEHPAAKHLPVTVVMLGESIAFCPVPFEVFSEICLRLRRYAPQRHALMVSLTNGYDAYLPTKDAIVRGGYEVWCFTYGSISALADDTDTILIGKFLELLRS